MEQNHNKKLNEFTLFLRHTHTRTHTHISGYLVFTTQSPGLATKWVHNNTTGIDIYLANVCILLKPCCLIFFLIWSFPVLFLFLYQYNLPSETVHVYLSVWFESSLWLTGASHREETYYNCAGVLVVRCLVQVCNNVVTKSSTCSARTDKPPTV